MCNEMQKEHHVIDFPLPDTMKSLRDIIDTHSKRTGVAVLPVKRVKPGSIKEVIRIYSGCPGYFCGTLHIVCGTVLKMSSFLVGVMRSLLTEECKDYWRKLGNKRPFGEDTRVLKKLISTQSFNKAKTFLNHEAMNDEDRINVVHRLRFLARKRESFKAFQSAEIESQSRFVLSARTEISKFDEFPGDEDSSNSKEYLKHNVLQTTLLDGDIREHIGAKEDLLSALVTAYMKAKGRQKIDQYNRRIQLENIPAEEELVRIAGYRKSEVSEHDVLAKDNDDATEIADADDTTAAVPDGEKAAEEDLETLLCTYGVELQEKILLVHEENSSDIKGIFDSVIADPFQKVPSDTGKDGEGDHGRYQNMLDELVDDKGVSLFVQCLRRLLTSGGFCFIFLDWSRLGQWTSCFENRQFEIIRQPFLVMKHPARIQKMKMNSLHSLYDPAVVAKKPGNHPNGFHMDKASPYLHLPPCRISR